MDGFTSITLSSYDWKQCITTDILRFQYNTSLREAVDIFLSHHLSQAPVVDEEGRLIGILDSLSLLKGLNLLENSNHAVTTLINEFIQQPQLVIYLEGNFGQNVNRVIESQTSALVIDSDGKFKGEMKYTQVMQTLNVLYEELECFVSKVIELPYNGIIAINSSGTTIFYNHSAERILGFPAQDMIGKSITQLLPDSFTYKVLKNGEAQRGVPLTYGDISVHADFTPIIVADKLLGAVAIFKDVTELQEVTGRLSTNEKLMATLEAIVENTYEGIIVINNQERIEIINQFFLDEMGMKAEDVIGKKINEISPESQLPNTLKSGEVQFGEHMNIGEKDFLIMRAPVERDGKIVGALGKTLFKNMEVAKIFAKKVMRLEGDVAYYKHELRRFHSSQYAFSDIIGNSPRMQAAKTLAKRAARTNSTILLLGESGTGKEVFAHAIHETSMRKNGPLIQINCAAVPENLLESELFGYAEGAFTGARKGGKPGKFELADKGTIFLDEIGDMPLSMQAKLLRVLQEREVERVGGTQPLKIDVRVIAATNRDLYQMVIDHKFRLDLYYRLNVINIELPPLRDREEDFEYITNSILQKLNHRLGSFIEGVTPEAFEYLRTYDWPGNIRELENILERAIITCDELWVQSWHLSLPLRNSTDRLLDSEGVDNNTQQNNYQNNQFTTLEEGLNEAERNMIHLALQRSHGNKMQAARLLGIHRSALYKKMSKHRLTQT
ncbi:diguanylate cyclase [Desulfitobacterium metallireducens DSM 15288]|uniref:Diguanylate cyclase n=2 Tax=Desulfitobacterium TaxID=36853 RepID=W0E7U2_9FIRM|nr:diguanylate cyclase [Desulfitobacterium metallireducens DSM 15288]